MPYASTPHPATMRRIAILLPLILLAISLLAWAWSYNVLKYDYYPIGISPWSPPDEIRQFNKQALAGKLLPWGQAATIASGLALFVVFWRARRSNHHTLA